MNILISGIGGPTPIGIAKSIKDNQIVKRIIGIDGNQFAPSLYDTAIFDKTYLVPHSSDSNYWNVIESIVSREMIDYAFIVPELEILKWSERQEKDTLPCPSMIPHLSICEAFYDKYSTFELLKETDLVPKTAKVLANASDAYLESFQMPFWLRAGSGAGAIGAFKISNVADFRNWTTINPNISNFIMSEFLPGRNYAVKVPFNKGEVFRAATGERIGYLLSNAAPSGISGMCSYGRLLNRTELVERAITAITTIFKIKNQPPHGMFTVDFKEDMAGIPKITEINIRHVSFTHAFALGGANFPVDTLRLFAEDATLDHNFHEYKFKKPYYFMRGVDAPLVLVPEEKLL